MKKTALTLASLFMAVFALADGHWVGTWGTAPQLVENHNNPPSPGLANNSLRQIVQVSIGGEKLRLKLTNEFSKGATEIKAVELAYAKTSGSSSEIDEASTVSLTFDGSASVSIPAGGKVTSDAVDFHLGSRENVAITIHYGAASSTSVSGHPGSRTTSYLKAGQTSDFSGATKTDHWYSILALEVEAPEETGAVAILGNSITDGRGSTTNEQNRWPDVLSRRLNAQFSDTHSQKVGVLNMGIGGNCVLGGGLGPAAVNRYQRDLLGQEGVKWIILFEAVNDLGGAQNGVQTAKRIIDVYKQIIREAHQKGIYVFGATITPFKGNNYYSVDHEKGRSTLNKWIRTTKMLDGVIDFDVAVRNPEDTIALQREFLFENDWLHLNAKGYETMGSCIDLSLFTKTDPLAADEEEDNYGEALWIEAEELRTKTVGTAFRQVDDGAASGGKYLLTVNNITNAAPADSANMLTARFAASTADTYYIYARVNCPTWDDDSYWVGVDGPMSNFANGLQTGGSWDWKELFSGFLQAGQHQLNLAGREDGACIDKLCFTTNPEAPTGMGGTAVPLSVSRPLSSRRSAASVDTYSLNGLRLTAQHTSGPHIEIQRTDDGSVLSRRVVLR
jgi:lysophospholipase L1-like esterase